MSYDTRYARRMLRWLQVIDFVTRVTGTRNRLRCPRCHAIGTWKPHGGILEPLSNYHVPRWLCKWCGLYFRGDLPRIIGEAHLGETCWEEGKGETPMSRCTRADGSYLDPWGG